MKVIAQVFSALPLVLIAYVLLYALFTKVDAYSAFVKGAKNAVPMLLDILPYVCAMMIAISLFRRSGALEAVTSFLSRLLAPLGIPGEVMPLFLLKPFSGSASLSLLSDIFAQHGPDSFVGRVASVLIGSTETLFYTTALYLGSVGVTKSRYIIPVSLVCSVVGLIGSVVAVRLMF